MRYIFVIAVYPLISRRRFQQLEVLEGQNILVTISGKKNKIRVYYLSWLKTKILKSDAVCISHLLITFY
jgi:mitogen-activated protein kinase kinase kinase kinase 4